MHDINNISNSIGTGGKYNEEGLGEHYRDKVSPCADPVVHIYVITDMSVSDVRSFQGS